MLSEEKADEFVALTLGMLRRAYENDGLVAFGKIIQDVSRMAGDDRGAWSAFDSRYRKAVRSSNEG
ncbi:hypothetical protein BJN34_21245 [Cupriavidus necator]|uniref:Uncharacterized protein n=1 Tax=Cupriavidus necator TaxID=106590 RepID=A0A1U9UVE2_CUPNE|nr:hypothetical protein [Cupriavidus necator]AQV96397.1 hypothetical protein BJN34_21245 [Cupriavidus necator]